MNKKTEYLLLSSILILFLALRIAFITQKNLWFDEVFSWHIIQGSFYNIITLTSADIHPPLYYFALKIWNGIFGDSVFSMRFLSTLFSVLTIFFIYPISKRVLTPAYYIILLILFAINPLNIFYSQEVRMSAMNLFLNAGSVYFLLRLLDRKYVWLPDFRQNEYYLYVLFRTAALYTHYFSFIIFIAEITLIILRLGVVGRSIENLPAGKSVQKGFIARLTPFVISFGTVLLLYLPWLPTFIEHSFRGQSWRNTQTISMAFSELINYVKDLNMGLYYHYTDLKLVNYITVFIVLIYFISFLVVTISIIKKRSFIRQSMIPLIFVLVPIIIGILISLKQKVEFYRYLSIIIPFILMFVLYSFSLINKKTIVAPVLILMMFINIFGITSGYSFNFKNDDYRPLIKHVENNFKDGDRIYVEPHYMGWSIDYYKKQWDLKLPDPVHIRFGWNEILDSLHTQKPDRFWVIFDYSAVDIAKYSEYINDLTEKNHLEERMTYFLAPSKVELYRFKMKYPKRAKWVSPPEINPEPIHKKGKYY